MPPGVVPLTFGEPTPDELSPPEELPSPLEGVVSGIVAVPAVAPEVLEPLELLDALEPAEAVEALDPGPFIEVLLPVVVLFRPPVVAVCAKMPSERPRKTALIILPSGPEGGSPTGI